MKTITDNTIVRVKVPKHLYEAVKARIEMLENSKLEEAKKAKNEKPEHQDAKSKKEKK